MSKIFLNIALFLMSFVPVLATAQTTPPQERKNYLSAKQELEDMLNGRKSLSYERAIYTIENAFYDNRIHYASFKKMIDENAAFIKKMADGYMNLKAEEMPSNNFWDKLRQYNNDGKGYHEKLVKNWAIFSFMTDSLLVLKSGTNIYAYEQEPLGYSAQDPLGTNDWTNTQVTKLFFKQTGNCFALASLFKIYAERLNTDANICTAPGHVYITHKDDDGRQFNIEVAGRVFPGIGTLATLTHTTQDALVNDISLRELNTRQSVALCLVYLAKGYEYKNQLKDDDGFMMACANSALSFDSLSLNAMLLKAEILERQAMRSGKSVAQLQGDKAFREYEGLVTHLYKLGYREMPLKMKNTLIKGWMRDSISYMASTDQANKATSPATRRASLSWGLFEEEIANKPVEKYGRTVFDVRKGKIVKFTKEDRLYNNYNFDPVVFAWNVDPMAYKFPHASPYNFVENNPISRIDPDGADWIVFAYKDKAGQTQINLTFAGAVMNSSGKQINMQAYMANEVKTFEKTFGQGNVHASMHLREITSTKDLKWHESLIDIQAGSQFKKNADGSVVGGDSHYGGKYIRINADGIDAKGAARDKKTLTHEVGHTGGLVHPFEFDNKDFGGFMNGNPFSLGVQKYYNSSNDMGIEANFMNYTKNAMDAYPMAPDKGALQSYFENNVGQATQGQTQTIINNLYNGNLNSDKDIPGK